MSDEPTLVQPGLADRNTQRDWSRIVGWTSGCVDLFLVAYIAARVLV